MRASTWAFCSLQLGLTSLVPVRADLVMHFPNGPAQASIEGYTADTPTSGTIAVYADATKGTVTSLTGPSFRCTVSSYSGVDHTKAFTAMLWFKSTSAPTEWSNLMGWGNNQADYQGPTLVYDSAGYFRMGYINYGKTASDRSAINDQQWHHLCATKPDGATQGHLTAMYVDGIASDKVFDSGYTLVFSSGPVTFHYSDTAYITDCRMYDHQLSAFEVSALYAGSYTLAAIYGDPHFRSFAGGTYDITGEANKIYNLISTREFQWNSQFEHQGRRGIRLGVSGFRLYGHNISFRANGMATVDGTTFDVSRRSASYVLSFPNPYHQLRLFRLVMVLNAPCFRVRLERKQKIYHARTMFSFTMNVMPTDVGALCSESHGLLGQTRQHTKHAVPRGLNGENVIEGTVDHYVVSSLFGIDFAYNQYANR
eukprot:NODE_2053_length_1526_cov_125.125445_g1955_i0.p1 GENE.NODE_2053_length_1526_cov_125.125445_g1955_i0~~NODE_2053_length_1526_cov_125.125445_g1955_i0.p1  ORF type:complete len:425 (+),score=12.68 NODE_2053_length_1526_cov_125.125445_g1955_i0:60-1334(+)